MRDYPAGAFEALTWVKVKLEGQEKKCAVCIIKQEVEEALNDLQHGVAVDFRQRLTSAF
jgi:hypothetical protein